MNDTTRELLRGFLDFIDVHLDRGNLDAVREALEDARRLVARSRDEEAKR
jgi:hypothetical protein